MKEYLINSGDFNIIVLPEKKNYYILEDNQASVAIVKDFIKGKQPHYESLRPCWFKYEANETWQDFDQHQHQLNIDLSESELIDKFVLKKFNFGGLVATRDGQSGKVKVFKRDKLAIDNSL